MAELPEEVKSSLEHKESFYAFGWSHGKEQLQGGVPDLGKGSYYNNPQYMEPALPRLAFPPRNSK